jgi:hypothetical protein
MYTLNVALNKCSTVNEILRSLLSALDLCSAPALLPPASLRLHPPHIRPRTVVVQPGVRHQRPTHGIAHCRGHLTRRPVRTPQSATRGAPTARTATHPERYTHPSFLTSASATRSPSSARRCCTYVRATPSPPSLDAASRYLSCPAAAMAVQSAAKCSSVPADRQPK